MKKKHVARLLKTGDDNGAFVYYVFVLRSRAAPAIPPRQQRIEVCCFEDAALWLFLKTT